MTGDQHTEHGDLARRSGRAAGVERAFHAARSLGVAVVIAASSVALGGCATSTSPYDDLERAAQPSDQLPDSVADDAAVNPESARLVGEYEGTQVWIALGASEDHACLVIAPTNGDTQIACDFFGRDISVSEGTAVNYLLVPNRGEAPDGDHLQLSTNVYVIAK